MPVWVWKASRVGRLDSSFSSTSMYCGQLENAGVFCVLDRSSLTQVDSVCWAPSVPHAARAPPAASIVPDARAPRIIVRRESGVSERRAAASGDSGGRLRLRMAGSRDEREGKLRATLETRSWHDAIRRHKGFRRET